jgi:hypothetical protein
MSGTVKTGKLISWLAIKKSKGIEPSLSSMAYMLAELIAIWGIYLKWAVRF